MNEGLVQGLWVAMALMLVIEGFMPFMSPSTFRKSLAQMASMNDRQLRVIGLFSMALGVALLYWVN